MKTPRPNRRKCREAAFQVLYCQSFTKKDLATSRAAVESVRTMEEFQQTAAALRETIDAAAAALRAVENAAQALHKAANPEEQPRHKPLDEGTLPTRLHLEDTRAKALEQIRKSADIIRQTEPLFDEKSFTLKLLRAVNRHEDKIDSVLGHSLEGWAVRRLTAEDGALLRLGTAELLFFEDVPPAVIIDEYVELAKSFGDKDSAKLVNGVLDRVRKDHRGSMKDEGGQSV